MKNILQRKQVIITDCNIGNEDFMTLHRIFSLTLRPGMSSRQFTLYYYSQKLQYIDVTFLYDGEQIAGFCAAAFYAADIAGKAVTIGRSAIGFLETHQGKTLPKWMLYYKYIRYKSKYPFSRVILTIYVANPIVYSMICKYTAIVYPRSTVDVNKKIDKIKDEVLLSSGLSKREAAPFVVKINFDVQKGEKLLQRILNTTDRHVRFFIKHTGLKPQMTLLVIIPISWKNILLTSLRFLTRMVLKNRKVLPATTKQITKKEQAQDITNRWQLVLQKAGTAREFFFKKSGRHIAFNCRNAANLVQQNYYKANKQTANDHWKRLRTLFTK